MRKAIVPGTFDPITAGHIDVVERTAKLFDEVVVAVAASADKRGRGTLFALEKRVSLARESLAALPNVAVEPFSCLLMDFAREQKASAVVKGLRATMDFEAEFQMAAVNYRLQPDIETLFVMSSPEHMYVSSSIVKEVAGLGGDVAGLVPPNVAQALRTHLSRVS